MFGKTDYITIQKPKIASSTLLCNTNWQPNWTEYYKLIFKRKETFKSGNFRNRSQSMSETILSSSRAKMNTFSEEKMASYIKPRGNTERNYRKHTREIISKV